MSLVKLVPVVMMLFALATIITTYIVSSSANHNSWWLPMISETGDEPPESSIFSWGLTLTAMAMMFTVYVRYLQVTQQLQKSQVSMSVRVDYFRRLNTAQLVIGLISGMALSLLANFQDSHVKVIHVPAALTFFFLSLAHCCMNAHLSKFTDGNNRPVLFAIRLVVCTVIAASIVIGIAFKIASRYPDWRMPAFAPWASFNEWVAVLSIGIYFQLYFFDLKLIHTLELNIETHSQAEDDQPILSEPQYDFSYGSERTIDTSAVMKALNV